MKFNRNISPLIITVLITAFSGFSTHSQNFPSQSVYDEAGSNLWLGTYGNFRLSDKFFWAGELHYRRSGYNGIPMVGRMAQIYNRHGIKYMFSKKFNATLGGVLRIDFTPDPGNDDYRTAVVEPRIWHEYVFAVPISSRFNIYHRLRIEHRWKKSTKVGAKYKYKNRYRYKFYMKIPINKPSLSPGAFYFSPDIELIMQSGKSVIDNPMEDLRIYPHFGYIINPRFATSIGMMFTTGQQENGGHVYRRRWILRINAYISLDFRKFEEKIPDIKMGD